MERQLDYWRRRLAGAPSTLDLPVDFPREGAKSFRGEQQPLALSPQLTRSLKELSRREGATLRMTTLGGCGDQAEQPEPDRVTEGGEYLGQLGRLVLAQGRGLQRGAAHTVVELDERVAREDGAWRQRFRPLLRLRPITGLSSGGIWSGAGKSTLANLVARRLLEAQARVEVLE